MTAWKPDDEFSLGIAESIRVRCSGNTLTAGNPYLSIAPALNTFSRYCHSLCPLEAEAFIKICCRDLVREFTNQRLDQVRETVSRQFPEEEVEPRSIVALTLDILINRADEMVPGLRDHFFSKLSSLFIEETSSERLAQLLGAVTVH